jgi:hypothetical protein
VDQSAWVLIKKDIDSMEQMLPEYFKGGEETGLPQGWQTRMVQGLLSAASIAKELIDGKCHSDEALKINE